MNGQGGFQDTRHGEAGRGCWGAAGPGITAGARSALPTVLRPALKLEAVSLFGGYVVGETARAADHLLRTVGAIPDRGRLGQRWLARAGAPRWWHLVNG